MSDNKAVITVQGISKYFSPSKGQGTMKQAVTSLFKSGKDTIMRDGYWALKDVSFEVKKGEFFGIVGRNGSGKSTLLKMIAGIYEPTDGKIQVDGKIVPFIELGVGFNNELSGKDNVYLNGALLGFTRKEITEMYDDIVAFAELQDHMDVKLKNFSSGMQVRLAFSIAIRAKSDILLLDEVLAVGDSAFQRKCYEYFMSLKKNKKTVILVTHDMGAVRQYCDTAVMIEEGNIVKRGKPEQVAQAYQKLFIDEIEDAKKKNGSLKNESDLRWGSGKLTAETPKIIIKDNKIIISCKYTASEDIEAPVLGFTIYGPSGTNILEGNTLRENYNTEPMFKNDSTSIVWTLPNILASGTYHVAVACCDQSTTEFYDWFNEAGSFIIVKEGNTAGVVDPELSATIKQG